MNYREWLEKELQKAEAQYEVKYQTYYGDGYGRLSTVQKAEYKIDAINAALSKLKGDTEHRETIYVAVARRLKYLQDMINVGADFEAIKEEISKCVVLYS